MEGARGNPPLRGTRLLRGCGLSFAGRGSARGFAGGGAGSTRSRLRTRLGELRVRSAFGLNDKPAGAGHRRLRARRGGSEVKQEPTVGGSQRPSELCTTNRRKLRGAACRGARGDGQGSLSQQPTSPGGCPLPRERRRLRSPAFPTAPCAQPPAANGNRWPLTSRGGQVGRFPWRRAALLCKRTHSGWDPGLALGDPGWRLIQGERPWRLISLLPDGRAGGRRLTPGGDRVRAPDPAGSLHPARVPSKLCSWAQWPEGRWEEPPMEEQ